jgi:hypothetical protein
MARRIAQETWDNSGGGNTMAIIWGSTPYDNKTPSISPIFLANKTPFFDG